MSALSVLGKLGLGIGKAGVGLARSAGSMYMRSARDGMGLNGILPGRTRRLARDGAPVTRTDEPLNDILASTQSIERNTAHNSSILSQISVNQKAADATNRSSIASTIAATAAIAGLGTLFTKFFSSPTEAAVPPKPVADPGLTGEEQRYSALTKMEHADEKPISKEDRDWTREQYGKIEVPKRFIPTGGPNDVQPISFNAGKKNPRVIRISADTITFKAETLKFKIGQGRGTFGAGAAGGFQRVAYSPGEGAYFPQMGSKQSAAMGSSQGTSSGVDMGPISGGGGPIQIGNASIGGPAVSGGGNAGASPMGSSGPSGGGNLTTGNMTGKPGDMSGDALKTGVYAAFRNAGYSHQGALLMSGEVNRENGFNPNLLFGTHKDPHNNATNVGMFSWQGSRSPEVMEHLRAAGAIDENGKLKRDQNTLNAMATFARKEMDKKEYGGGRLNKALEAETIDRNALADDVGRNYIKWRVDDPQYRGSGVRNREQGYSATEAAVARSGVQGNPGTVAYNSDESAPVALNGVKSNRVIENQGREASIRKGDLKDELRAQLGYAADKTDVYVDVKSGGQRMHGAPGSKGSHRHDHGGAADFDLYVMENGKKRYLSANNPADRARMADFAKHATTAGATGMGHGGEYMGARRMHVGGGSQTTWGSSGGGGWLGQAQREGIADRPEFNKSGGLAAYQKQQEQRTQAAEMPPPPAPVPLDKELTSAPGPKPQAQAAPSASAGNSDTGKPAPSNLGTEQASKDTMLPAIEVEAPDGVSNPAKNDDTR